jgi:hypothetical protein
MRPQQSGLVDMNQQNFNINMPPSLTTHQSAPEVYTQHDMGNSFNDPNQGPQMPPPDINIVFAPASRQNSFEPPKPVQIDQDALTPPQRGT